MPPRISFVTANFVARQIGYRMEQGWMQGETATQAWFAPVETFAQRFDEMLLEIKALGFTEIDLWAAHLHWRWATLLHLDAARAALARHGLAVRSYAAWVGGGEAELTGACRLCAALNIPFIAGNIELFGRDRPAAVAILREHAVRYAIENHPEKDAAELWARLGAGDEDVVGLALDTGWCATRGWDAAVALREFRSRVFCVHLKDVAARRPQKTGFEMIDLGHETCRLGDGIVPVPEVVRMLRETDFRGPLCIEHEPEDHDPRAETAESRRRVEAWWTAVEVRQSAPPLRVAVVGCGNIANAYGQAMRAHPELQILGATDLDPARARAWVEQNGGTAFASLDALLADPSIEVVVNLTIQPAHVEVVTRALEAGKHVHSEKPLAPTYAEAGRLVALADARKLRLSCAPVTWLGEAQQTAWKLIRDGRLGTPRVAYANVNWGRIESWHPNPVPFYAVGPVFDVGVYPLSLLTAWFGPVARVTAGGGVVLPDRKAKDGTTFRLTTEDWTVAILEFRSGMQARLTANFYVGLPCDNLAGLEVHGDAGSLATTWYAATAPVRFGSFGGRYQRVWPVREPVGTDEWWVDWAAGPLELWRALRHGTAHPTTGAQAAHVVEVIELIHRSIREQRSLPVSSSFAAPQPLDWAE
jgi:predicted dehydrogenase/sugar phosphate isomerase/epimerase